MEIITYDPNTIAWRELTEFPGRAEVKTLRDDRPHGPRTLLLRLREGGTINPDVHPAMVQYFVIAGEYESEGHTYPAGTYRQFPGHAKVPPVWTRHGVTILMIYDPV